MAAGALLTLEDEIVMVMLHRRRPRVDAELVGLDATSDWMPVDLWTRS